MGLFRGLGRRVERLTRQVAAAADATHACADCEATFGQARETCPECGSEAVAELD